MDFWQTVLVLVRRWYITVPTFLVTLGMGGAAYFLLPVQYESNSVLVLTSPLSGPTEATQPDHPNPITNPMLNFERSLALSAAVVIQEMSSPETARDLGVTAGSTTRFEVTNGSTNPELLESGPFIFVQGVGSTPQAAQEIAQKASAMAAEILDRRQNELQAPPSTHIGMKEVVPASVGQPLKGSSLRAAAGCGALAVLMGITAAFGFESMMTYRRQRRGRTANPRSGDFSRAPAHHDAPSGSAAVEVAAVASRRADRRADRLAVEER